MRRYHGSFACALTALFVTGCMAGGPEQLPAEAAEEAPQHTEAMAEIEANLETCDVMCTIDKWVAAERYAEAREVLNKTIDASPEDIAAVLKLGSVNIADEEYQAAYELAQAYVDRPVDGAVDLRVMEQRARASLMADDVETAANDYNELLDMLEANEAAATPREGRAWVGLATANYNRGELEAAENIARDLLSHSAIKDQVDPAHGWFILALAAGKKGDDAVSREYYDKVLARYPNEPATLNNIGCIEYRNGDLDSALTFHQKAYDLAGKNRRLAAIAWSNVAEVDMLNGRYDLAEDRWLETLSISKRFAAGHFNLAVLYDLLGQDEKSARHMKTALDIDVQGVTRWNTSFFTPEWKQHFQALVANAQGRADTVTLWQGLAQAEVEVIRKAAQRHLPRQ